MIFKFSKKIILFAFFLNFLFLHENLLAVGLEVNQQFYSDSSVENVGDSIYSSSVSFQKPSSEVLSEMSAFNPRVLRTDVDRSFDENFGLELERVTVFNQTAMATLETSGSGLPSEPHFDQSQMIILTDQGVNGVINNSVINAIRYYQGPEGMAGVDQFNPQGLSSINEFIYSPVGSEIVESVVNHQVTSSQTRAIRGYLASLQEHRELVQQVRYNNYRRQVNRSLEDIAASNLNSGLQLVQSLQDQRHNTQSLIDYNELTAKIVKSQEIMSDPLSVKIYSELNQSSVSSLLDSIALSVEKRNQNDFVAAIEQLYYSSPAGAISFENSYLNEEGVFLPEKLFENQQASPFSAYPISSTGQTAQGQLVRRFINKFQAFYGFSDELQSMPDSNKKMSFLVGASLVVKADKHFSKGQYGQGLISLRLSQSLYEFISGASSSLVDAAVDSVNLVPNLVHAFNDYAKRVKENPYLLVETAVSLATASPLEFAYAIEQAYREKFNTLLSGTAREKGEVFGEIAFDALIGGVTSGAGAIATKGRVVYKAIDRSTEAYRRLKHSMRDVYDKIPRYARSEKASIHITQLDEALLNYNLPLVTEFSSAQTQLLRATQALQTARQAGAGSALYNSRREIARYVRDNPGPSTDFAVRAMGSSVIHGSTPPPLGSVLVRDFDSFVSLKQRHQELSGVLDRLARNGQLKGVKIEGYFGRYIPKGRSNPWDLHENSSYSVSRYGVGGEEGVATVSIGFSTRSADEALGVAASEIRSYNNINMSTMSEFSQRFTFDNVINLRGMPNNLGLNLIRNRNTLDAYRDTSILGERFKELYNFNGIIAPSAVDPSKDVFIKLR